MPQRDLYFIFRHNHNIGGFASLVHRRSRPFEVTIYFSTEYGFEEWLCDIELLRQALAGDHAGIGDLQLYSAPEDPTKLVLYLANDEAHTELLLDKNDIEAFCRPIKITKVESRLWINRGLRQVLDI